MILAVASSSVVIVRATVERPLLNKSWSRVTRFDFVTIWIRQLLSARISRHFLVQPAVASKRGYGSEELAIDTTSPFNFAASRFRFWSRSFLGRHLSKLGM